MSHLFLKDIPNRMLTKIAYVNFYMPSKTDPKVLALTQDLHLFELKRKEIIFDCDLTGTVLNDTQLPLYVFDPPDNRSESEWSNVSQRSDLQQSESVQFGKYFSYTGRRTRLFLLVKAFDKLIVVERTSNGFQVTREYVNVERFEISDPENSFLARVAVYFSGQSEPVLEDFLDGTAAKDCSGYSEAGGEADESFRTVSEQINRARSELAVHQVTTKRQFIALKDRLMFGPNQVRSDRIEEKQPLGKYGDIWMKICGDDLVIGIPVINNCSRRLTVLHNVRAVIVCPDKDTVDFEYDIYQLNDDAYEFDNLEELLNSKEGRNNELSFSKEWLPIKDKVLCPETCGVLVLQTQLKSLLNTTVCNLCCHCFILYDIIGNKRTTTQQYYVKTIEINTDILCFPEYQITFGPNSTYKDLLAVSATSKLFTWKIEHKSDLFEEKLSAFLIRTFGFTRIVGNEKRSENMEMEIEEEFYPFMGSKDVLDRATSSRFQPKKGSTEMFYHIPTGHNHLMGTLIRFESLSEKLHLKVYVSDEYKALYIFSKLYKEFEEECTIQPTNFTLENCNQKTNLQNLEEGLRKELQIAIENVKACAKKKNLMRSEVYEKQMSLYGQELLTDILYRNEQ